MSVPNITTSLTTGPKVSTKLPEKVGYTPRMPTLDACKPFQLFPLEEFPLTS